MKVRIRVRCPRPSEVITIMTKLTLIHPCWFEVQPLPNNEWFITVKAEQEAFFRKEFEVLDVFYEDKNQFYGNIFITKGTDGYTLVQVSRYPEGLLFKVGCMVVGMSHQEGCNLARTLKWNCNENFKDLWILDINGMFRFKIGPAPSDTGYNFANLPYHQVVQLKAAMLGEIV